MAKNNTVRLNTTPQMGAQLRRIQKMQLANGFKMSLENIAAIAMHEGMSNMMVRFGLKKAQSK